MIEIKLPADLQSDLNWENISITDAPIKWHLDFGWNEKPLDPKNSAHFHSYLLAIEQFEKQIWSPYFKQTKGVVLAHIHEETLSDIESANILSDYLHRLASFLPSECPAVLKIEISSKDDLAKWSHFFCLRRFEYFQLEFIKEILPVRNYGASLALVVPSDEKINLQNFNKMLLSCEMKGICYQCLPEELLNEYWGGLESLLVDQTTLSDLGERMLQGFAASGGNIRAEI